MLTEEQFWDSIASNIRCKNCIVPKHEKLPKCECGYPCSSTLWAFYSKVAKLDRVRKMKELRGEIDAILETT